jgi:hypothetical protein
MSYDPKKTRELLTMLAAHDSNPVFEYISELATQLRGASDAIAAAEKKARDSESTANGYAAQLEAANQTIRRMREEQEAKAKPTPAAKVKRTRAKKAASTGVMS